LIHNPSIQSLEEKNFRKYFSKVKNKLGYQFERKIFTLKKKENIDIFPHVTQVLKVNNQTHRVTIDGELQQYAKNILNKTLDELHHKNVTN
jgi:DNA-binding transcriptional regulator GbsR (MarR family)